MADYGGSWTQKHFTLEIAEFTSAKDLIRCLNAIRRIPFSVKASRDEARNRLIDLPRVTVSKAERFPDGVYVNLTFGIVSKSIDRLLAALDHGERELDREPSGSKYSSLGDSKVAFMKGVQALLQMLVRPPTTLVGEGVFNRATFENYYALVWP